MSDNPQEPYGDPFTQPFWEAARERKLLLQRCGQCGMYQFYPRPYCINCQSEEIGWMEAEGTGTVHSLTTVHLQVLPELEPPYQTALIELDEGPRVLSTLPGHQCRIGDRVSVVWQERDPLPPLPLFEIVDRERSSG